MRADETSTTRTATTKDHHDHANDCDKNIAPSTRKTAFREINTSVQQYIHGGFQGFQGALFEKHTGACCEPKNERKAATHALEEHRRRCTHGHRNTSFETRTGHPSTATQLKHNAAACLHQGRIAKTLHGLALEKRLRPHHKHVAQGEAGLGAKFFGGIHGPHAHPHDTDAGVIDLRQVMPQLLCVLPGDQNGGSTQRRDGRRSKQLQR